MEGEGMRRRRAGGAQAPPYQHCGMEQAGRGGCGTAAEAELRDRGTVTEGGPLQRLGAMRSGPVAGARSVAVPASCHTVPLAASSHTHPDLTPAALPLQGPPRYCLLC